MTTAGDVMRRVQESEYQLSNLKDRLSHATSYTERRSLTRRIRGLEDLLDQLYARYMKAEGKNPVTVYGTSRKPRIAAGLAVRMDISTDGQYFSNPAPKISHGQRVWVRLIIDIAQRSPFATHKTIIPRRIRCTWVIPRRWRRLDWYSRYGRNEYMVSIPLIVTREFTAPGSGSTAAKFGCFVDPYFFVEPLHTQPAEGATLGQSEITAHFDPGTYRIYTRTSNTLSSAANITIDASDWLVDEADEKLFYTDGLVNLVVRAIQSGPYSGKYFIVQQEGITLTEGTPDDPDDTA